MKEALLAHRYAKALFELALEKDKLEEIRHDMQLVYEVSSESMDFRPMLRSPVIRPDKKVAIVDAVFKDKTDRITLDYFRLLARNRREYFMDHISLQFMEIYKKHFNITTVYLKTAIPVSEDLRKQILRRLEKFTGGTIDLVEKIDDKLIGGFVVNIDDQQYDASLSRQISRLKKEFDKNLYIREL